MNQTGILIAGFGGQGALFAGKLLAHSALMEDKQLSWLPSYGPEMRGGTANCGVIISDSPVGSPIVSEPDVLIAMNRPSFDKFEPLCVPGASIFSDSTLIDAKSARADVKEFDVPATELSQEKELQGLSNIILVGKMIKETGVLKLSTCEEALRQIIPPKKAFLIEKNIEALRTGYGYEEGSCK